MVEEFTKMLQACDAHSTEYVDRYCIYLAVGRRLYSSRMTPNMSNSPTKF